MAKTASRRPRVTDAPPYLPMRGHPLSDDEFHKGTPTTLWSPRLEYGWDTGRAVGRFLEGLCEGKIYGVRCRICGRVVTPPREFCELDFKPMDEWVELSDTGTINTFSICYVTWDMKALRTPQVPAVVEIDGTSPRVGFLHLIGGLRGTTVEAIRAQIAVGTPVRAVWKKPKDREGAITDILHFTPLGARRKRG
jgi:uncharacterized OB-fold protein